MKKELIGGILTLLPVIAIVAQGRVALDAYNSSFNPTVRWWQPVGDYPNYAGGYPQPLITYGAFTIGFYWAQGAVNYTDPYGTVIGGYSIPDSPFTLATGTGATTSTFIGDTFVGSGSSFVVPGISYGTVTIIVIAYNGASYASSTLRGHSLPFQVNVSPMLPQLVGDYMPSFFVSHLEGYSAVPEPSPLALAILGVAMLALNARRKRP
jgi:hypothetical protein